MEHAVILSACRTPIGSFGGALKDLSAADLGAVVVRAALTRAAVDPAQVGDVILGCVLQGGAGMNVARQAALKACLSTRPPKQSTGSADRAWRLSFTPVKRFVWALRIS